MRVEWGGTNNPQKLTNEMLTPMLADLRVTYARPLPPPFALLFLSVLTLAVSSFYVCILLYF